MDVAVARKKKELKETILKKKILKRRSPMLFAALCEQSSHLPARLRVSPSPLCLSVKSSLRAAPSPKHPLFLSPLSTTSHSSSSSRSESPFIVNRKQQHSKLGVPHNIANKRVVSFYSFPVMRRSAAAGQRDAARRDKNGRSNISSSGAGIHTNNNNSSSSSGFSSLSTSGAAALRTWLQPRLLRITTQLLSLQPQGPLHALATAFAMEGLLLTAYPESSALTAGREREHAERDGGEGKTEANASRRTSPMPGGPAAKPAIRGKAQVGNGENTSTVSAAAAGYLSSGGDDTLAHGGLRRLLQPYGLHAIARSVCPASPVADHHEESGEREREKRAERVAAARLQWMECFALLHRQSRLTPAECAAASRRAMQISGSVLPPVDFRATEEVPASLFLLYVWVFIEQHVRRTRDDAEKASAAAFLRCRTQLSVVLLTLEWWVVLQRQEEQASMVVDVPAEGGIENKGVHQDTSLSPPTTPSSSLLLLDALLRLSTEDMERFYRWLQRCLRSALLSPAAKATASSSVDAAVLRGDGVDDESDLSVLRAHVTLLLGGVLHNAADALPAVVSLDVFTTLMQHVAALASALSDTAVAMTITLCARVPRETAASDPGGATALRWAGSILKGCTAHVLGCTDTVATPDARNTAFALPAVWKMHAGQIRAALPPAYRSDAQRGEELSVDALCGFSEDVRASPLAQTCAQLPCSVAASAMVHAWVTRIFAVHPPVASSPSPSQTVP